MRQCFDIAERIRAIIAERGLFKKYVAEKAGFTERQFSDMLNGRKVIRAEHLPPIAKALGVNIGELFTVTAQDSA